MGKLEEQIAKECRRLWITDSHDTMMGEHDIRNLAKTFYNLGRQEAIDESCEFISTEADDYFDCERPQVTSFKRGYKEHMEKKQ